MTTTKIVDGVEATKLYPMPSFQRASGLGRAAIRTARKNGLKVRYANGRAWVLGADFLSYTDNQTTPPS